MAGQGLRCGAVLPGLFISISIRCGADWHRDRMALHFRLEIQSIV
jgi:hypothetical protein